MAVPTNWTELKAEITTFSVRDDLEDLIPNFIGYAENLFNRELFGPDRETSVTLTVTDGVASLPADFAGARAVYVDGNRDTVLDQVTPDELRRLYPGSDTDTPLHFAIYGSEIRFGPVPSDGLTIILEYDEGIPALGTSQATNWLLTAHPDIYVNAALAELCEYTHDYDEAGRRLSRAMAALGSINRHGRRRKYAGPLQASRQLAQFRNIKA